MLQEMTSGLAGEGSGPRAMFVFAHPDDEAIAVGSRLAGFAQSLFLQATDGAPRDNADGSCLGFSREEYRAARQQELLEAMCIGGLPTPRHLCLEYADKEAALNLVALTEAVLDHIQAERPSLIFTHPYEGGHADHDACCFAVHTAVARLRLEDRSVPLIAESPFYFRRADGGLQTGLFPANAGTPSCHYQLTAGQQRLKQAVFSAFQTQAAVLRIFPTNQETYRIAPDYRFTEPPHEGPTWSETITPDLDARRFCELAAKAQQLLPRAGHTWA